MTAENAFILRGIGAVIRIGICDDERVYREQIREICESFYDEGEAEYFLSSNGAELPGGDEESDILFLVIEMPGADGILIKNLLEAKHAGTKIVFMTSHSERMREAFGVNVAGFVIKPICREDVEDILRHLNEIMDKRTVEISAGGRNVVIPLSDILFISADDKYSYVHTRDAKYLVRETLSEWEQKLPNPEFCRCSRFNVINMKFYDKKNKCAVFDGEVINVSRSYRNRVDEIYRDYLRKAAKG